MTRRIAVLGGGISGLTAAWNLASRGSAGALEVVLYEASSRVGGWMKTHTTSQGAVFECGPRSLRVTGHSAKTTMKLVSAIGLENEVLPVRSSSKAAQKRLIYTNRTGPVQLPSGPSWLFRTKPPFSKPLLGVVLRELMAKAGTGDESVFDFFSRRVGDEVTQYLVDPLCRGVYASSAKTLSVRSCFPQLVELESKYGSLVKGMLLDRLNKDATEVSALSQRAKDERWSVYTFRSGLQTLPDTLLTKIKERGVTVKMDQPCTELTFKDGKAMVKSGAEMEVFDNVVSTVSAKVLSQLLCGEQSQLSDDLSSIPCVTVGVVGLEYRAGDILPQDYREAFGYLVPSSESSRILGVVFDSASFPSQDRKDGPSTRLTVMMGGEWFDGLFGDPGSVREDTLSQIALEELNRQIGISAPPSFISTAILRDSIAQYAVGHSAKLDSISQRVSGLPLSLCGASYRGVSVNDCVHYAVEATNKIL
uniref:Protoporphyrinogen oxidase n=1 Tax=Halichondria panicea TaxID=6063 RepID=A0A6C0SMS7_HALPA|nr:protoporphyrinogen oxidase [Halichondria panicea]QIZ30884.1 protoporphyrinogen oxidase [Halichondria panicea]